MEVAMIDAITADDHDGRFKEYNAVYINEFKIFCFFWAVVSQYFLFNQINQGTGKIAIVFVRKIIFLRYF